LRLIRRINKELILYENLIKISPSEEKADILNLAVIKGGSQVVLTFYLCFLAGGAVLPFLSAIMGSLSDGSDTDLDVSADTDIDTMLDTGMEIETDASFDLDSGGDLSSDLGSAISIGFFPTSLMALSALAITFGAVGSIMTLTEKGAILTFVVSILSGYFISVVVQSIIKTLKKLQRRNYAIEEKELLMYEGKVIDTILPGQLGTVSFTTLKNVHVSYPARCADEALKLIPGREVKVIEIKNGVVIVEPKNKYE
jgi:hypothetical protein